MKRTRSAALWLLCVAHAAAFGRGVSPYLPLNIEPEIEQQIERVLILADKPVMTRPIAAATVLEALPKACKVDAQLCEQVGRYLARYTHDTGLTDLSVEASATNGSDVSLPERYGLHNRSVWDGSLQAYIQPSDFLLVNLGAVAYDGEENPTGSMLSLGFSKAQLDIGYKPHWFSPLSDSSMLMSSEAPTMPSVSLSNYEPLTRLGLQYEFFVARMTHADHIVFGDGYTAGNPHLAGFHIAMEPASGWSFALNRLLQYGGGARGGSSISDLFRSFVNPSGSQSAAPGSVQNASNQEASVTSSLLFPGRVPFTVYVEYAGEDTSHGKNYLLGNAALSMGIHFSRLWQHFDLTVEASEMQNQWYVNGIWQDGLINDGHIVGAWFGDQRVYNDQVGAQSQMVRLGWDGAPFGGVFELRYRTLENQDYGPYSYHRFRDLTLGYSRPWKQYTVGVELEGGQDVFGASFSRVSGFMRFNPDAGLPVVIADALEEGTSADDTKRGELFVAAGATEYRVTTDLTLGVPKKTSGNATSPHFELGARRALTEHQDLGTRIELENISGHSLVGVRLLDYRWRFDNPIALSAYLGAARYALATPAYGFYYGLGVQYRNVLPGWDVGVDVRYDDSIARDHLLPSDPPDVGQRNDTFYDVWGAVFTVSRKF